MHQFFQIFAIAVTSFAISACATPGADTSAPSSTGTMVIQGSLAYRQRIALPSDAVAEVTFSDVSRADAPSVVLERMTMPLRGRQVPVLFTLKVDLARLVPKNRYAVRATVHNVAGQLLWTTDTMHTVEPVAGAFNTGTLTLIQVRP